MSVLVSDKNEYILIIKDELESKLKEHKVSAKISYRLKEPYSILKKVALKNIPISELSDVIAFRIIVENPVSCHSLLNVINELYHIEAVKDYISTPKSNYYRSLHIVLFSGIHRRAIEIQVRTEQMHYEAESGKANHASYKQDQERMIKDLVLLELSKIPNDALNRVYNMFNKFEWSSCEFYEYEKELIDIWEHCKDKLQIVQETFKRDFTSD